MSRLKGFKHSEETRKKISNSKKGSNFSEEHKKKISIANKGRKLSEETKRKMSEWHKNLPKEKHSFFGKHLSEEHKKKIGEANSVILKGRKLSEEWKKKISKNSACFWKGKHLSKEVKRKKRIAMKGRFTGEENRNWKGGITPLKKQIRESFEGKEWIRKVFERDNYTCQKTKIKGKKLEAHHIKSFAKIIEENSIKTLEQALNCQELWEIDNGITLSKKAHDEFHNKYGWKKNTREQLNEFLKQ